MLEVKENKEQLAKFDLKEIKGRVEKDAWIALKQYFDGKGNGSEAKIAVVIIGTLAKEMQASNNKRQLDIVEKKLELGVGNNRLVPA